MMQMKIKKVLPIFLFLITLPFYAQNEKMDEKREKIKAYKVSFLTTELELTSTESEKFWPIYNTYDDKQFELRHKKMKSYMKKLNDEENIKNMSESDAASLLSQMESTDAELYLLRKKYFTSLKKILPAKKIIILRKSEDDFNRKLLHQYRDKAGKN
jgi:hypothetical protein